MALADTLPSYITDILSSQGYEDFIESLRKSYTLSDDQTAACEKIIFDLFRKKIAPENLLNIITSRIGRDEMQSKALARVIMLNIVVAFHFFFGDYSQCYADLGGNTEEDVEASPILRALAQETTTALEQYTKENSHIDFEKEQNSMRTLFAKHLTDHFTAPDGDYKVRLNDTILALLKMYDAYNEKLLGALYENEQEIGVGEITLPDGTKQRPTVANYIKDFLGFSGGTISSIMLAKYVSQNKNVSSLQERDKDAVRRLLETFIVLKNFPDSLDSIPEDQWKIIPYYHTEETTKVPRKEMLDDKIVPSPTITIVPAPEPQAMAKPVLPLGEQGQAQTTGSRIGSGTRLRQGFGAAVAKTEPDPVKIDFSPLTDAVIVKTGAILQDTARERVKKILETRIRNVRNDIDTKGRLMAPVTEGGAGLGVEEADKMLAEAKNAQQMIAEGTIDEYAPKKRVDNLSLDSRRSLSRVSPRDQDDRGNGDAATPKMVIKEVDGVPTLVEKSEKKGNGKKEEKGVDNVSLDSRLRGNDREGGDDRGGQDDKEVPHEGVHVSGTGSGTRLRQGFGAAVAKTEPDPALSQIPPVKVPPHLEDAKVIPVVVKTSSSTGERGQAQKMGSETTGSGTRLRQGFGAAVAKTEPDPKMSQASPIGAQKKQIPDVKALPRLVTVVDELRALSMKDIRRISHDMKAACQKIADKINALAKESLTKRAEAINAWKESPAYALYLEIGQLNISQDMAKLAEERKTAGKEYLTAEEFDALLDLNEKLRF